MRNASMKVLKNLVCCAAFICLMFVLAMPAHAASKADELLQLVNAERAQAGVTPLSMGSSALNAAAQARAEELTVNYSYNRPNGSREFTILPEYGVEDVSVGENYWAAAEDASDVVAAWNRYDFFKERMLDKDATSVGVGYYEGGEYGNYWVMIFTYARGTSENGFAQEVLALVNAERAKENLAPLAMGDAKLQAAADERAKEVAKIENFLLEDNKSGLIILHGKQGTGKTTYIRHLINLGKKRMIYMSGDLVDKLSDPSFITFIRQQKNSIFIVEDCEELLSSRNGGNRMNAGLVNILNISDGLLSDELCIKFICTFNAPLKDIDEALLRKGRLAARYEFKDLTTDKVNQLIKEESLDIPEQTHPMTLAEIYNYEGMDFSQGRKRVGF